MIVSVVTIPAFVAVLVRLVGRPRIIAIERNLLQLVFVEVRLLNTDCAGAITTSISTLGRPNPCRCHRCGVRALLGLCELVLCGLRTLLGLGEPCERLHFFRHRIGRIIDLHGLLTNPLHILGRRLAAEAQRCPFDIALLPFGL